MPALLKNMQNTELEIKYTLKKLKLKVKIKNKFNEPSEVTNIYQNFFNLKNLQTNQRTKVNFSKFKPYFI